MTWEGLPRKLGCFPPRSQQIDSNMSKISWFQDDFEIFIKLKQSVQHFLKQQKVEFLSRKMSGIHIEDQLLLRKPIWDGTKPWVVIRKEDEQSSRKCYQNWIIFWKKNKDQHKINGIFMSMGRLTQSTNKESELFGHSHESCTKKAQYKRNFRHKTHGQNWWIWSLLGHDVVWNECSILWRTPDLDILWNTGIITYSTSTWMNFFRKCILVT